MCVCVCVCVCVCIYPTPPYVLDVTQDRLFLWSLPGLNSDFFLRIDHLPYQEQVCLTILLKAGGGVVRPSNMPNATPMSSQKRCRSI